MDRRGFFKALGGVASLPVVGKLPAPVREQIVKLSAWAEARIVGGKITSVTIINSGRGYTNSPTIKLSE